MTTKSAGATIQYTTDGADPAKPGKNVYTFTGPVIICKMGTHTIKAIATEPGFDSSAVSTKNYIVEKAPCVDTVWEKCPPKGSPEYKDWTTNDDSDHTGCTFW